MNSEESWSRDWICGVTHSSHNFGWSPSAPSSRMLELRTDHWDRKASDANWSHCAKHNKVVLHEDPVDLHFQTNPGRGTRETALHSEPKDCPVRTTKPHIEDAMHPCSTHRVGSLHLVGVLASDLEQPTNVLQKEGSCFSGGSNTTTSDIGRITGMRGN